MQASQNPHVFVIKLQKLTNNDNYRSYIVILSIGVEYSDYTNWIHERSIRGNVFFSLADIEKDYPEVSKEVIHVALSRMQDKGLIVSPWKTFYVIVPTEYKLKGEVPPSYYIDELMKYLHRDYYVCLLSAAAIYGACHQRSQTYYIMASGKSLRDGVKNGTRLVFSQRQDIPKAYVRQIKTQTGMMNISSPLMTALDIINMESKIGGMSRAAEIIAELDESFGLSTECYGLLKNYPVPVIQRFGYILSILEYHEHAQWVTDACKTLDIRFRKTPLKAGKPCEESHEIDKQWKLIINTQIEVDEL